MNKFRTKYWIFLLLTIYLQSFDSMANQSKSHEYYLNKYSVELSAISNYLQNIKYLSSSFVQKSSDEKKTTGRFYLSRPGKMRIEYDDPVNVVVNVNGSVLAYEDLELKEISNISTNSTPASFLTRKKISFSAKDVEITNFVKLEDSLIVSVRKKNRREAGEFSLIFNTNPLEFARMEVKNDLDQVASISFIGDVSYERIPNDLFKVKNTNLPE